MLVINFVYISIGIYRITDYYAPVCSPLPHTSPLNHCRDNISGLIDTSKTGFRVDIISFYPSSKEKRCETVIRDFKNSSIIEKT